MMLTKKFGHKEFFVSERFPDLARQSKYTRPNYIDDNLYMLCKIILQPARDITSKRIIINSGYRGEELNQALGGSENSLHKRGKAADFTLDDKQLLYDCYDFIEEHLGDRISELFLYQDKEDNPAFIHVALADITNRSLDTGYKEL